MSVRERYVVLGKFHSERWIPVRSGDGSSGRVRALGGRGDGVKGQLQGTGGSAAKVDFAGGVGSAGGNCPARTGEVEPVKPGLAGGARARHPPVSR